jgi:Thiamin pyrophosphokinase, catalytic domain
MTSPGVLLITERHLYPRMSHYVPGHYAPGRSQESKDFCIPANITVQPKPCASGIDFALIMLNSRPTPGAIDAQYILKLWPKGKFSPMSLTQLGLEQLVFAAKIRACADGGANRLATLNKEQGHELYPDFICGDMDSALKENIELFREKVRAQGFGWAFRIAVLLLLSLVR